jgi:tRNA G18 (ribose-2'-O)-methylase SpoU
LSRSAPVEVNDAGDPRLEDYRDLTDVSLRKRTEPAHGLFIAEGELVVRRALTAGYPMRSLLVAANQLDRVRDLAVDAPAAPVYVASHEVLAAVTGFHVHRGVLAAMARLPVPTLDEVLGPDVRRIAVLEDLNNSTNLGAVFRCAAALGMDAVLLSPACGDPLYRRSVRVSMGEVFALPHARVPNWPRGLSRLAEAGYRLLALTPDASAVPLDKVCPDDDERLALLLGAEGPGLSGEALAAADEWVRIPMAHGVDSLNVAAAAAVAFWVLGRR